MTPTLEALARQLAADPRWRWLPGMRYPTIRGGSGGATWSLAAGRVPDDGRPPMKGAIPDLSDAVTAAALLVLARVVSGCPEAVAGTVNGRWVVFRSLAEYRTWSEDFLGRFAPLTGVDEDDDVFAYATEIEALASVILRGGE